MEVQFEGQIKLIYCRQFLMLMYIGGPLLSFMLEYFYSLLDREAFHLATHILVISLLDYCNALYMGYPYNNLEASVGTKCGHMGNFRHPKKSACNTFVPQAALGDSLLPGLIVLVVTDKSLHGMGPGYLQNCLHPII